VFPVRYELGFCVPEDGILQREELFKCTAVLKDKKEVQSEKNK
jgi:uncharacterized protein YqgQ